MAVNSRVVAASATILATFSGRAGLMKLVFTEHVLRVTHDCESPFLDLALEGAAQNCRQQGVDLAGRRGLEGL